MHCLKFCSTGQFFFLKAFRLEECSHKDLICFTDSDSDFELKPKLPTGTPIGPVFNPIPVSTYQHDSATDPIQTQTPIPGPNSEVRSLQEDTTSVPDTSTTGTDGSNPDEQEGLLPVP